MGLIERIRRRMPGGQREGGDPDPQRLSPENPFDAALSKFDQSLSAPYSRDQVKGAFTELEKLTFNEFGHGGNPYDILERCIYLRTLAYQAGSLALDKGDGVTAQWFQLIFEDYSKPVEAIFEALDRAQKRLEL